MKTLEVFKIPWFQDNRGIFVPLELDHQWVQSNISISKKWTFRGLHHQLGVYSQSKKIMVVKGSIIDFAVDLHKNNFGEAYQFRMVPGDSVIIPAGFAHGFLALENDTTIHYLVNNVYAPPYEVSFNWKSVQLVRDTIEVTLGINNLSEKDLYITDKDSKYAKDLTKEDSK